MKKLETILPYILLALCFGCTLLVLTWDEGEETQTVSAGAAIQRHFAGEHLFKTPYLPNEPAFCEKLGLWQTHPALDVECTQAVSPVRGKIARVWQDAVWGTCVEIATEKGELVLKNLLCAHAREGQQIESGDVVGEAAGYVHAQYIVGGETADPAPLYGGK